jgi:hypothetical protein
MNLNTDLNNNQNSNNLNENIMQKQSNVKSPKSKKDQAEEFMNTLHQKCEKLMHTSKKVQKISDENIVIPTMDTYNILLDHNYNATQLKLFAKHLKVKTTGNKQQLFIRIYCFLKLSKGAIKIQKLGRGYLQRKYNRLHGPAFMKRDICTNDSDFLTGDLIKDIQFQQFFSFSDVDNFVYGFDMISLYNLFSKSTPARPKNPYNRNEIPPFVLMNIRSLIRLSRILKIHLDLVIQDDTLDLPDEKAIELRALSLFQNIDALGNYSSPEWFLSLNRHQTIKMLRELLDIWDYRAQITNDAKRAICPPHGLLTTNQNLHTIFNEQNIWKLRKYMLDIMERLVNSGVDQDSKTLGAYYVLGSLTIVNQNAATALPWLFQSFSPIN